jgi:formamidopyrimidine-DNA glycosylase
MIELPEALSIARQLSAAVAGRRIVEVTAAHTPHKLAWYYGNQSGYAGLLRGRSLGDAKAHGSLVEIEVGEARILLGEGVSIRFHDFGEARPPKHQFLLEFEDESGLSVAVQMYGGMGAFKEGDLDNPYYMVAKRKPSPLSAGFDEDYFRAMASGPEVQKLSLKAFLATEQRIPGLGNGVLQDILFNARMHPKRKVNTLGDRDRMILFESIKDTLANMAEQEGRDTEMDIFGRPGNYRTILSKNSANKPCRECGTVIRKEAYMGGSIYYCEKCQRQ